jgi:hypothetical protein
VYVLVSRELKLRLHFAYGHKMRMTIFLTNQRGILKGRINRSFIFYYRIWRKNNPLMPSQMDLATVTEVYKSALPFVTSKCGQAYWKTIFSILSNYRRPQVSRPLNPSLVGRTTISVLSKFRSLRDCLCHHNWGLVSHERPLIIKNSFRNFGISVHSEMALLPNRLHCIKN